MLTPEQTNQLALKVAKAIESNVEPQLRPELPTYDEEEKRQLLKIQTIVIIPMRAYFNQLPPEIKEVSWPTERGIFFDTPFVYSVLDAVVELLKNKKATS